MSILSYSVPITLIFMLNSFLISYSFCMVKGTIHSINKRTVQTIVIQILKESLLFHLFNAWRIRKVSAKYNFYVTNFSQFSKQSLRWNVKRLKVQLFDKISINVTNGIDGKTFLFNYLYEKDYFSWLLTVDFYLYLYVIIIKFTYKDWDFSKHC